MPSGIYRNLFSVYFIDANIGWAVGYHRTIIKTTDGGINWTVQSSESPAYDLHSVHFLDANTGYAVGRETILKTTDGGINWIIQTSVTPYCLYSVYFTDAYTGYAVGENGTILKTTNNKELSSKHNQIVLYPNPAINDITVYISEIPASQNYYMFIYNLQGEMVMQQAITQGKTEISINELAKGLYIVKISNDDNTTVIKFVKE